MTVIPGIGGPLRDDPSLYFIDNIKDSGLASGLQLCTDYADGRCYTSSETMTDLSGLANSVINGQTTGSTVGDLTFNGVVNRGSKNDFFASTAASQGMMVNTSPVFLTDSHKASALFTMAGWFWLEGTDPTVRVIWSDYNVGNVATRGMALFVQSGGLHFQSDNVYHISTPLTVVLYNQWAFFATAIDNPGASGTVQFNAFQQAGTPGMSGTAAPTAKMSIGMNSAKAFSLGTGSKHAGVFGWNRRLSAGELMTLYNETKDRFA